MRTKGRPAELEARRSRAATPLGQGRRPGEVARLVGVTPSCVSTWRKALRNRGITGIKANPHPGPAPRLGVTHRRRLVAALRTRDRPVQRHRLRSRASLSAQRSIRRHATHRAVLTCGDVRPTGPGAFSERMDSGLRRNDVINHSAQADSSPSRARLIVQVLAALAYRARVAGQVLQFLLEQPHLQQRPDPGEQFESVERL